MTDPTPSLLEVAERLTGLVNAALADNEVLERIHRVECAELDDLRSRLSAMEEVVHKLTTALQRISDLKDEAYEDEPVSCEVADVVARNAGRIAHAALDAASEKQP